MENINIIDRFTETFVRYIDSGFGLLQGEVAYLTTVIVGIDIVLAGLFWAFDTNKDVIASLIKKVLYVGFFALLLNNFAVLTDIIFRSFAGLGLEAVENSPFSANTLLRPGFVAATGFTAAHPILLEIGESFSLIDLFNPLALATTLVLLFAWLLVVLSFFILAIQLFITIIEFKLTTLAGYVLVPFALWKKSAFLAERVLGNVIAAGIKLMVLAVIVGIGATLFAEFTAAFDRSEDIEMENAMVLVLAALSLVGLAIFVPGIAAGLVSGAPQLGAGAAIGTVGGVAAGAMAGAGLGAAAARTAGTGVSGAVKAASKVGGGASAAYGLGRATSATTGAAGIAAGVAGIARAGAGAAAQGAQQAGARAAGGIRSSFGEGRQGAWSATGGSSLGSQSGSAPVEPAIDAAPGWAKQMRREQHLRRAGRATAQAVREGDRPGAPANPSLDDKDD